MTWKTLEEELPKVGDSIILLIISDEDKYEVYGEVQKALNGFLKVEVKIPNMENVFFYISDALGNSISPKDKWFKLPFTREEIENIIHTRE